MSVDRSSKNFIHNFWINVFKIMNRNKSILREIIIFQKLIQELNCTLTLLAHRRLILKILDNNAYTSPYAKIRQFFLLLFLLPSSLSFPPPPSPRATVSSLRPCAVAFLLKFKSSSSRGRERERETGERDGRGIYRECSRDIPHEFMNPPTQFA